MSTTIGPAFKLADDVRNDLFGFADLIRATLAPRIETLFFQHVHTNSLHTYDNASRAFVPFSDIVKKELQDTCFCDPKDRDPFAQTAINLKTYIFHNRIRDEFYLLIPNLFSELESDILTLPHVTGDYSYYDGTDAQLDEMSEEEWHDRREAWAETLDFRVPLSRQGVCIDVGLERHRITFAEYQKHAGTYTTEDDVIRQARMLRSLYITLVGATFTESQQRWDFAIQVISEPGTNLYQQERYAAEMAEAQEKLRTIWEERKHVRS